MDQTIHNRILSKICCDVFTCRIWLTSNIQHSIMNLSYMPFKNSKFSYHYNTCKTGTRRNFGGWRHCIFIWRSADCPYYWGTVCWHLGSMPEKWVPNSVVSVQNIFLILNCRVFHHQSLWCSGNTLDCWCEIAPVARVRIRLTAKVILYASSMEH